MRQMDVEERVRGVERRKRLPWSQRERRETTVLERGTRGRVRDASCDGELV